MTRKNSTMHQPVSILCISFLLLVNCSPSKLFPSDGPVFDLTVERFRDEVESPSSPSKPHYVILFYSSFCSHCRKFAPHYSTAAESFRIAPKVKFFAPDWANTANWDIFRTRDIRFFPTVYTVSTMQNDNGEWVSEWRVQLAEPFESFRDRIAETWPYLRGHAIDDSQVMDFHASSQNINAVSSTAIHADASLALAVMLRLEVFRGNSIAITPNVQESLFVLLGLCMNMLHLSTTRSDCLFLRDRLSHSETISRTEWHFLLSQTSSLDYPDVEPKFASCNTYTCAVWRLFHIFSLGPMGMSSDLTAADAMNGIRTVVEAFVSCTECRTHFLEGFDSCAFGRCNVEESSMEWSHTALWLWRFHNGVTSRVNSVNTTWPDIRICPECYTEKSAVNETSILSFLYRTFSLNESKSAPRMDSDVDVGNGKHMNTLLSVSPMHYILVVLCIVMWLPSP